MREILFRGKRIDNGEWAEGYYVLIGSCHRIYTGEIDINKSFENQYGLLIPEKTNYLVNPKTVCQYTGLTDKNGKKIFEGDIVKTSKFGVDDGNGHNFSGFDLFSVKWDNGGFALFNRRRRFNLREDEKAYEVIGNIFDNPELLGGDAD